MNSQYLLDRIDKLQEKIEYLQDQVDFLQNQISYFHEKICKIQAEEIELLKSLVYPKEKIEDITACDLTYHTEKLKRWCCQIGIPIEE